MPKLDRLADAFVEPEDVVRSAPASNDQQDLRESCERRFPAEYSKRAKLMRPTKR